MLAVVGDFYHEGYGLPVLDAGVGFGGQGAFSSDDEAGEEVLRAEGFEDAAAGEEEAVFGAAWGGEL